MIKVIAWATDGSPSARRALSVAKDLARAHDARLLVLHVQGTGLTRKGFFNDAIRASWQPSTASPVSFAKKASRPSSS